MHCQKNPTDCVMVKLEFYNAFCTVVDFLLSHPVDQGPLSGNLTTQTALSWCGLNPIKLALTGWVSVNVLCVDLLRAMMTMQSRSRSGTRG